MSFFNAVCSNLSQENTDDLEVEDTEIPVSQAKTLKNNKHNHINKKLSAHQREMMQIDLAREELALKKKY